MPGYFLGYFRKCTREYHREQPSMREIINIHANLCTYTQKYPAMEVGVIPSSRVNPGLQDPLFHDKEI